MADSSLHAGRALRFGKREVECNGCLRLVDFALGIREPLDIPVETWGAARPALVNSKSKVLAGHCRRSHGGLCYNDRNECEAALRVIDKETKARLGAQGQDYVRIRDRWDRIESDYLRALDPSQMNNTDRAVTSRLGRDAGNG